MMETRSIDREGGEDRGALSPRRDRVPTVAPVGELARSSEERLLRPTVATAPPFPTVVPTATTAAALANVKRKAEGGKDKGESEGGRRKKERGGRMPCGSHNIFGVNDI